MIQTTFYQIRTAIVLLLILLLLTGLLYPALVTMTAQALFSWKADGSLIKRKGMVVGSKWIGQPFSNPGYFWGRPSATHSFPYNASDSSGSHFGPSSIPFLTIVKKRVNDLRKDHTPSELIPVDLVTASGSGLDPDISPLAAYYQVSRIAKVRHLSEEQIKMIIDNQIQGRTFGLLGEYRVNVLQLNMILDELR